MIIKKEYSFYTLRIPAFFWDTLELALLSFYQKPIAIPGGMQKHSPIHVLKKTPAHAR